MINKCLGLTPVYCLLDKITGLAISLTPWLTTKLSRTGGIQYSMQTLLESLSLSRLVRDSAKTLMVVKLSLAATLSNVAWKAVSKELEEQKLRHRP